ncbi:MAG: glutathionylspermidine synthase family protein [Lachnospiraceae bacterium]|jgi:glutathione synthase/RimK-type ligase-like ATP-grasp enzyme|nr:glutathionylspermidine synthase family protein [Lachnospiraceae bacterium]
MSKATELTKEYIELTKKDLKAHTETAKEANHYIVNSTAQYHGRCVKSLYVPKIYTEREEQLFSDLVETICGIFYKVMERYEKDEAYRRLFGFEPKLEELILRKPRYKSPIPMARIDIFLNEETGDFKFCEFNTDGTSAMNEDRELNIAIKKTRAYQEMGEKYEFHTMELFDSWVETFLEIYHTCDHAVESPNIAIVDFMENATETEFEMFAKHFREHGMKAEVCEIRDLKYRDHRLYTPNGMEIDAVYRRAVTSDIMTHYNEVRDFIEAVKSDNVCLIGDFRTQIAHNKILYKILHLQETQDFLSEKERAFVKAHVPMTYSIHDKRLSVEKVLAEKNHWILKPEDSYGSKGIHAGVECEKAEWKEYFLRERENEKSTYLIQEFCTPYRSMNIDLVQGDTEFFPVYNLTGLFAYGGRFCGVYSRISKNEIISTQYSEMALPTLFAKERS